MDDRYTPGSRYRDEDDAMKRALRWLSKRPAESWGFFIAGMLVAGILF